MTSARRGFWAKLFGAPAASPAALGAPPPVAPAAPTQLLAPEEQWLDALALDVAAGRRFDELTSPELDRQLAELDHAGRSRAALGWLTKFSSLPTIPAPTRQRLRLRLARRHADRLELDEAEPHLAALLAEPPPLAPTDAADVHALLAEHARGRGDRPAALRHYEAVLAVDVDYPNVRARVARLRAEDGRREVALGETLASGELRGISAGSRYQLVRELGRGATGAVYLARDAELGRDVAVKLLHPHLAGATSAEALHQFFREARVMASLRHPNIVAVLDLDQRSRRIVMEVAAGGTLRDVLRERGPRPLRRALEHLAQILAALTAAHARGITHRDLKPANLMFRRPADSAGVEVMLGDFGIAHLPDASAAASSGGNEPRAAVGTLGYMAPEQRRGEPATPASDLYALGVVLFEMLVGRLPWDRETMMRGTRSLGDLRLPDDVAAALPPAVTAPLQALLDALGDPDPLARPTAAAALEVAHTLREQAMLASALR